VEELTIFRHKLSRSVPKCRDGIPEFVHANYEAVYFLVLPHESEWVIINIAVELDSRFNTPVPIILPHDLLVVKESRVKSAHVSVR